MLSEVFGSSDDLKLLAIAPMMSETMQTLIRITARCCVMWGDPRSWQDHELECDVNVGVPRGDGAPAFAQIGMTAPAATPDNA
jgi:hypothetical protein